MTIKGALNGGSLKSVLRYGDLENKISIGSAAAFLAKDRFKEHVPYSVEIGTDGIKTYVMNPHFLAEARRQLSGVENQGTSTFSLEERIFWNDYIEYINDSPKTEELIKALEVLDSWLIDEIMLLSQYKLERNYELEHKWRKTEEYVHDEGILWI